MIEAMLDHRTTSRVTACLGRQSATGRSSGCSGDAKRLGGATPPMLSLYTSWGVRKLSLEARLPHLRHGWLIENVGEPRRVASLGGYLRCFKAGFVLDLARDASPAL